jgi:hypothetical protein
MRLIASAIVVAGGLIAASIALTRHFSIGATATHVAVFRLNNWTGEIALCTAEITQQGFAPLMRCRSEMTDAEAFGSAPQTDQFGGVRVPQAKAK